MEQDDDNESTKSEVKLGKLQFQLDYDFTKNEVGHSPSVFFYCDALQNNVCHQTWRRLDVSSLGLCIICLNNGDYFNLIYQITLKNKNSYSYLYNWRKIKLDIFI